MEIYMWERQPDQEQGIGLCFLPSWSLFSYCFVFCLFLFCFVLLFVLLFFLIFCFCSAFLLFVFFFVLFLFWFLFLPAQTAYNEYGYDCPSPLHVLGLSMTHLLMYFHKTQILCLKQRVRSFFHAIFTHSSKNFLLHEIKRQMPPICEGVIEVSPVSMYHGPRPGENVTVDRVGNV